MIPAREQIVAAHPIDAYLEAAGHPLTKSGGAHVCRCPFHDDKTPSMSVTADRGLWYCHACGFGGSVVDLEMRLKGCSVKDALAQLAERAGIMDRAEWERPRKTATYEYRDEHGRVVMKVDRTDAGSKKKFAQYREQDGKRINTVEGVQKTLYRLEKWSTEEDIHICEGEKCVHAMERLGWHATCNPGGGSAWLDAYSVYLANKDVTIWPDNDEPGRKWTDAVLNSLETKARSVRVMTVPPIYGDIADLIDAQGDDMARETVYEMDRNVPRLAPGVNVPLLSSAECYELYRKRVAAMGEDGVDLSKWLPSLRSHSRVLLPGDLALFLSDTGVGKTSVLINIAQSQRPVPTIFFQLELSPEPMCERFIARTMTVETLEVERATLRGETFNVAEWDHVFICPRSKLTIEDMEEIIGRAELKMRRRPVLILVDYVGLMGGGSGKRYERMSTIAESLKTLARTTETVIVMASQVRRDADRVEVDLHDSKDSGSLENSAQLVMGAWRPAADRMSIKILKQTKRAGQVTIDCSFDGDRQTIRELSNIVEGVYQ